ncbi:MAG: universal stress protein [Gammaproteobacteria bacterium]|nr:universal stress protein [Gammaproteobacteria bacterium]
MKHFKNILFVTEPEVDNGLALERTIDLARDNQAKLTVIDVIDNSPSGLSAIPHGFTAQTLQQAFAEERKEQLDKLLEFASKKLNINTVITSGIPYLEVVNRVLEGDYDLVIKPAYISDGLNTRLFGGTDFHLLRKCPIPVWLMKTEKDTKIKKILAAIDIGHEGENESGNALGLQIMELASSQALAEFAELHIVHAWEVFGENMLRHGRGSISPEEVNRYVDEEEKRHHQWVEKVYHTSIRNLGEDALTYLKPKIHLPKGVPKKVIPKLVKEMDIDLVVMGTVARTGIPGFFMGNTAESILQSINCSVLAVKPDGFVSPVTKSR